MCRVDHSQCPIECKRRKIKCDRFALPLSFFLDVRSSQLLYLGNTHADLAYAVMNKTSASGTSLSLCEPPLPSKLYIYFDSY